MLTWAKLVVAFTTMDAMVAVAFTCVNPEFSDPRVVKVVFVRRHYLQVTSELQHK